ncbi:MAG: beta-lactamase family protein, partial [Oscillospiraceae bacterium]|nr:beta-lactamase family protein [Oscillospiraceae bacterium]
PVSTVELANKLGQCPLAFQPGARWRYGTSADAMAAVVEVASGQQYGRFLQDALFGPLGMDDTGFFVPASKQARLAKTYRETADGLVLHSGNQLGIVDSMLSPPAFESGGAGLTSTIDDYMTFARMLLGGGALNGTRVMSPKTVEYYTTPQLNNAAQIQDLDDHWTNGLAGFSYGNFMRIMERPSNAVFMASPGEYGWDGALGVYFMNAPRENLTFLFMTQRAGSGTLPVTRRLRNIVFAALE